MGNCCSKAGFKDCLGQSKKSKCKVNKKAMTYLDNTIRHNRKRKLEKIEKKGQIKDCLKKS